MSQQRLLYYTEGDHAYMIDSPDDSTTYLCYTSSDPRIIKRISKSGTVTTIEFSYGSWENRSSLRYFPVCDPIDLGALQDGGAEA